LFDPNTNNSKQKVEQDVVEDDEEGYERYLTKLDEHIDKVIMETLEDHNSTQIMKAECPSSI